MRSLLVTLLLLMATCHLPAQTVGISDNTTFCSAGFSSGPEPLNPLIIHFLDTSAGQITLWQWNFGDGTTSTVQNPVHAYSAGGTYFVCLTVSNNEPGLICHDVRCIAITIHEPGTCVADYQYAFIPGNGMGVHFSDLSSGNINSWHWDFGDGTYSDDPNPDHTFQAFGKYRVCLTAYNSDSVSTCNDVKCDSVEINPPAVCHALFSSRLDTLNPLPNTFKFINLSTGDPNRFRWKFDDGAVYESGNVIHHFQSSGQHEVCLVIRKEEQGVILCSDSICMTVISPRYLDLGGHLFAGAYPINNPVSTGDTGVAYLYRADGSRLLPYDTCRFTQNGYYAFPTILEGSYIIRAALTPGSAHYTKNFPAYYRHEMTWTAANILPLADANCYNADIFLSPATDTLTGPCTIRGTVQKAYSKSAFDMLPDAEVILLDGHLKPVTFTFSGKYGQFELDSLPYGAYNIYVEYPGKYSRVTAVWLDSSVTVIEHLQLEVFNHDVTGIPGFAGTKIFTGELFPNPASAFVYFTLDLPLPVTLTIEIRTMTGLQVWSGTNMYHAGSGMAAIPLSSMRPGMYLVMVRTVDGTPVAVKKLIRY